MQVKIGTFSKEINSTKQPDVSHWKDLNVQLKGDCSIQDPAIIVERGSFTPAYNYVYIPAWGRYYFINDAICMTGERWELDLVIDVLASWKANILASSAYVSRSASNYSLLLPDSTWSHTSDITTSAQSIDFGFNSSGTFLLFTASDDSQSGSRGIPALSVYDVPGVELKNICNYMFSSDFFETATEGLDEETQALAKTFFNPFQYVVKCMWLPLPYGFAGTNRANLSFGWWDQDEYFGYAITSSYITKSASFTVGTYNDWTDRDPAWTRVTLYVPGFGQMEIGADFVGKVLTATIVIDLATGQAGLFITTDSGTLISSATGQIGAEVQLSSLYEDAISDFGSAGTAIVTGVRAGLGSLYSGTKAAVSAFKEGGISSLMSNIGNISSAAVEGAQDALQPTMSTIGAMGARGITQYGGCNGILSITKHARYEDIHSTLGGVCNKVLPLSGLTGYTEIVNPHFTCNATSGEITMINSFLSGGFYIE